MDNPAGSRSSAAPSAALASTVAPVAAAAAAATHATPTTPTVDAGRRDMRHPLPSNAATARATASASARRSRQNDAPSSPQPPPQPHPPPAQAQARSQPQPHSHPEAQSHSDLQPQSALMSPATTGPSPPSRPSSHPQPPAPAPDPPPPPVTVSTDLPPPSTRPSQSSPTCTLSLSNLQVSPGPPHGSPTRPALRVNTGVPTPPPTRTSEGNVGDFFRGPSNNADTLNDMRETQSVQTGQSHSQASRQLPQSPQPLQIYHDHVQRRQQRQQQQQHVANAHSPSTFVPNVDTAFFKHSIRNLENFTAYLERIGYRAETVEFARLQLLNTACRNQDCLYLVIHQVYCLYSFSPSEFLKLPGYTQQQVLGLSVIEKVMVDNSQVSPDFLRWCAHFPGQIAVLLQTPVYRKAVQDAAVVLGQFEKQWNGYIQHVFARGYPPFVTELIEKFGITSESLAYSIFLSTCRQLLGPSDELALKTVWKRDLQNYRKRCTSELPVSPTQIQREDAEVIQMYRSLPCPGRNAVPSQQQQPQPQAAHQSAQSPNSTARPSIVSTTAPGIGRPTGIPSPQPSQSPQMPVPPLPPTGSGIDTRRSSSSQASPSFAAFQLPTGNSRAGVPSPGESAPMPAEVRRPRGRPRRANGAHQPSSRPTPGTGTSIISPQMGTPSQIMYPSQLVEAFSARQAASIAQRVNPVPAQAQVATELWPSESPRNHASQMSPRLAHPFVHHAPAPAPIHVAQPLLPPPGYKPPTTSRPHPLRDALHQAHLRGPVNQVQAREHEQDAGLFQYISGFAVKPVPLGTEECAFKWRFTLSQSDLDRIPASQIPSLGQRAVRTYKDGSQIHRLRCIRVSPETSGVSEQAWCTAESTWPSVIYVFINDVEAFVRRRVHNGKDLPLDISHYLHEGLNTVSVHFIRSGSESRDLTYAMAVEVLDIAGFSRTKELAKPLTSADSHEQIRARLSFLGPQDDEVSVVSDNLTIDLVDPFMAKIFNTPVRGRFCGHRECFDHDTWILTRASKSGNAPMKEDWRCPICYQDARPQSLLVDGFLVEVREDLARNNRLETARAIQVKADGSWQVRAETETSDRTAPKRKLNGTNNIKDSPVSQRPKLERRPSSITNGDAGAQPTRQTTSEVIALD